MTDFETVPVGTTKELECIKQERDALAAHLERLQEAGKAIRHELAQWALTERDPETAAAMSHFDHVASETPATSLTRHNLIKQAELMEQLAAGPAQAWDYIEMTRLAIDLRQQASQLEEEPCQS